MVARQFPGSRLTTSVLQPTAAAQMAGARRADRQQALLRHAPAPPAEADALHARHQITSIANYVYAFLLPP